MYRARLFSVMASIIVSLCVLTLAACSGSSNEGPNETPRSFPTVFSFNQSFISADEITLQGSNSTDYDGTIASYHWTQLTGSSQVDFSNPNGAETTFIAPSSLATETYVFQLEVTDDRGATDTATLDIVIEPSVNCASCNINQINTLHDSDSFIGELYGQVVALEGSVLAVANQVSNKIEFHDLASGNIQKEIQLNSAPDKLYFQSARQLLYASLVGTTAIAQININTDQVQTFQISGVVGSMSGGDDRVYYIFEDQFLNYALFSLGYEGDERSHGNVSGDLIAYNASRNEIINAESNDSGGSLNRYGFNGSGQLEFIQTADPESSGFFGPVPFAINISISSNGQQMAIASNYGSNSARVPIMDIPPENIQISNGAWLSDTAVAWVDFSTADKYLITAHDSFEKEAVVVTVYDATSKVRVFEKAIRSCDDVSINSIQTGFSTDNQYFYTQINCGHIFDTEQNAFVSYTKFPEL